MEITYSLIQTLIVKETWDDNKVRLAFKAPNQQEPIEVLGFAVADQENSFANQNSSKAIREINLTEDLKQKTILSTFKTVMCYYYYEGNTWVYSIPKAGKI